MSAAAPSHARRRVRLWHLPVAAASIFGLVLLAPDFLDSTPTYNDRVLHRTLTAYAAAHWDQVWPLDFWWPAISGGFPMFAQYQHLSHLLPAALARATGGDAAALQGTIDWLLLGLVPAIAYVSLRRMGLPMRASALGAALYPLVRTRPYFGIGWESYLAIGSGLTPQLWATALIFPALAWGYAAVQGGGDAVLIEGGTRLERPPRRHALASVVAAGLLLALCVLAHTIFAYIVMLTLVVWVLLPNPGLSLVRRLGRLASVGAVSAAGCAYFAVPLALLSEHALRSQWELDWKWDSIGLPNVLRALLHGELFDATAPVPVVSLLVAGGGMVALVRAWRGARLERAVLAGFLLWTLLFGGRATWGRLADLLPLASGLHMHRFIAGVQVFGLVLAALGFDALVGWIPEWWRGGGVRRLAAGVAAALVLASLGLPVLERVRFVREDLRLVGARRAGLESAQAFPALVETLRGLPPGRVYAGLHNDWGARFRIGDIPVYAHLQAAGFDMVGYLFMAMAIPAEWQIRLDWSRPDAFDLYDARWIVAPANLVVPSFLSPRARHGGLALYEAPTTGYFAVGHVEKVPPSAWSTGARARVPWGEVYEMGRRWAFGSGPTERRYLALGSTAPPPLAGATRGRVVVEEVAPDRYAAQVALATPADVVLKVTAHPWWRASVDGVRVPATPIFPGFMAVRVPPGEHEIDFRYRPPRWKKALFALAVATFVGGTALLTRVGNSSKMPGRANARATSTVPDEETPS